MSCWRALIVLPYLISSILLSRSRSRRSLGKLCVVRNARFLMRLCWRSSSWIVRSMTAKALGSILIRWLSLRYSSWITINAHSFLSARGNCEGPHSFKHCESSPLNQTLRGFPTHSNIAGINTGV